MATLLNISVLVLGLGDSGLAMARWCVRQGARVTVADTRENPPNLLQLRAEFPQINFRAGAFTADLIDGTGIRAVFKSPGLTPSQVASVLKAASALGIWIDNEIGLFYQGLECLKISQNYSPQILAITGTNGKTTVTSLTGQLVQRSGKTVAVAGNIGPTLLDTLSAHLDAGTLPQVWVLELSSFQLDSATEFTPTMGVVLNLTQDHLDWHGSMQAYGLAKKKVFGFDGTKGNAMLLNRDDQDVMAMLDAPGKGKQQRTHITFGTDMPSRPGDWGLETVNGMTWLVKAMVVDETRRRRKDAAEEVYIQRLMPADALRIRGTHNAANALAALALASAADCSLASILYGLREYRGEPHRVELVGIVNEVEYFDDSKGTNVGATVAALNGLGAERKLVVILGGQGKGQEFKPLASPVQRFARAAVLLGEATSAIENSLEGLDVPIIPAVSMEEAVSLAAQYACKGDAVLLSPACASFDMFKNYVHRAEVFRSAVAALASAAGGVWVEQV